MAPKKQQDNSVRIQKVVKAPGNLPGNGFAEKYGVNVAPLSARVNGDLDYLRYRIQSRDQSAGQCPTHFSLSLPTETHLQ